MEVLNVPSDTLNDFKLNDCGNSSNTFTLKASLGPLLLILMLYETISPSLYVYFETVFVIDKSAAGFTCTVALSSLLDQSGSF